MHIPEDEAERRRLNERGREILRRKNGAVRPHREDGYVNLLNKYGTKQDNSEAYKFEREPVIPDMQLTGLYEGNGLFSKIIDTPAEEALKHGFDLNLKGVHHRRKGGRAVRSESGTSVPAVCPEHRRVARRFIVKSRFDIRCTKC